jgi:hypothetical protein
MAFEFFKSLIVGGATSVGIDPSSKYLLVVSHSGRGLFKLSDGRRVARDYEVFGPWYYGAQSVGFGPLHKVTIPIFGFGNKTPDVILQYLDRNGISYELEVPWCGDLKRS